MSRTSKKKKFSKTHYPEDDVPQLDYCDDLFSKMVREARGWRCVRCNTDFRHRQFGLELSHFFNKGKYSSVRYDPRNVDPLCHSCHTGAAGWEFQKHGEYLRYMQAKLGSEGFTELRTKSRQRQSLDEAKATFLQQVKEGTLWDVA